MTEPMAMDEGDGVTRRDAEARDREAGVDDESPRGGPAPLPAAPWSVPRVRRTRRGARPPLDREVIVDAALRIVDDEGVDALSFRRLADDLGVTAMSLYWHVTDKAELLELVGQRVLDAVETPPARGDWRSQLRDVHVAMIDAFLRHPNAAELMIGRARFGAAGLALFERILSILLQAGFSPRAAFDAYQSLYLFTLGFTATSTRSPEFREVQRQGLDYMLALPEDRFPSIRSVAPVIGRRTLAEQFEIGLDVVIAGLAELVAPAG
jgi:AcrR family transcriptional regulator